MEHSQNTEYNADKEEQPIGAPDPLGEIREALAGERMELLRREENLQLRLYEELQRRLYEAKRREQVAEKLLAAAEKTAAELARREASAALREQELTVLEAGAAEKQKCLDENLARALEKGRAEVQQQLAEEKLQGEQQMAAYFSTQRTSVMQKLGSECEALRESQFRQLDEEIGRERASRLKSVEAEAAERRKALEQELSARRQAAAAELKREQDALAERQKALQTLEQSLDARQKEVEDQQQKLTEDKNQLEFNRMLMTTRENALKEQERLIPEKTAEAIQEKQRSMDGELARAREEADRLRGILQGMQKEMKACKDIQEVWGAEADGLLDRLNQLQTRNEELKQELAERPPAELEDECKKLRAEKDALKDRCSALQAKQSSFDQAEDKIESLQRDKRRLEDKVKELESEVNESRSQCDLLRARLERYRKPAELLQGRAERVQEIERPYLEITSNQYKLDRAQPADEIAWLSGIENRCRDYGISFPRRILYAFHTSLKISDWSSITVLAGVSGTGKSELPRLYSIFGGINFISVPVQPNWDSQESMLGYFNSIDNRFDAQPLLRFLVQCTNEKKNDPPGPEGARAVNPSKYPYPLGKYMSIVLLDEMNLAHVEHYFADFLSKLESRRGLARDDVPSIEVKLGAGYESYALKLARNVLWVGTMNQDETTKSLSDKVLDRGIVIHFPRPTTLNSRSSMKNLSKEERTLLSYRTWNSWCRRETGFTSGSLRAEIDQYRSFVEQINEQLERSGRAIGHRVWQSIEYYLANYPTVIAAMKDQSGEEELSPALRSALKTAFEDQIVQKIMPKLRGIETRGAGKQQLDGIRQLLQDMGFNSLLEDFENASTRGYGQFVWNSAHYLEEDKEPANLPEGTDAEERPEQ